MSRLSKDLFDAHSSAGAVGGEGGGSDSPWQEPELRRLLEREFMSCPGRRLGVGLPSLQSREPGWTGRSSGRSRVDSLPALFRPSPDARPMRASAATPSPVSTPSRPSRQPRIRNSSGPSSTICPAFRSSRRTRAVLPSGEMRGPNGPADRDASTSRAVATGAPGRWSVGLEIEIRSSPSCSNSGIRVPGPFVTAAMSRPSTPRRSIAVRSVHRSHDDVRTTTRR